MPAAEPIMASVDLWPGTFAPDGWFFCNGQDLAVSQYQALFSLLGTIYGGNGSTTFKVPDLRGRVALGVGQQPGGTNYPLAATGGVETVTLATNQCAVTPHTHPTTVVDPVYGATVTDPVYTPSTTSSVKPGAHDGSRGVVTSNTPVNNFPVALAAGANNYATTSNANMGASTVNITVTLTKTTAGSVAISKTTGGSVTVQPNSGAAAQTAHENRMPYLALYYIIAWQGIYPIRP